MKYIKSILVTAVLTMLPVMAQAASAWPASTTATNIASGLTTRNTTANGFEASGVDYLSSTTGYIVVGDDGDVALLSTSGSVSQYWNAYQTAVNDFEDVTVTDSSTTDNKVYIANEYGSKIEEFNISTGLKTGLSWTLSDLPVSGGSGFEALAYVPAASAPASWGTAQSGGFFLAASQAEKIVRVYTFSRGSSSTGVSSVTTITLMNSATAANTYYDIGSLQYNSSTNVLYVVFDTDSRLKEYSLAGTLLQTSGADRSYYLPTYGTTGTDGSPASEEGLVIVPNCSTGKAQVALTVDNISSRVNVYSNYPVTCVTTPVTTVDADGDGVASTSDCNDNDITVSANQTYYRDVDGDGLGDSTLPNPVCSSTAPSDYVSDHSDLNDQDYDNDDVITSLDCDDSLASISANQTYYRDADGDGYGTSATTSVVCSYTVTSGYVTNASDLNDSDFDNDGASTGSDCNDADNSISVNQTYYRDADGDGFGTSATTSVVCSYTVTTGYVTNASDLNDSDYDNDGVTSSSDCNDADSTVNSLLLVYQDYDGDGLGNPAVTQSVCATSAPSGYVTNSSDTDDSGIVTVPPVESTPVEPTPTEPTPVEPTPADPEPTYSAVEYSGNGIDDDGDGSIDEVNTVASNGYHPIYSIFEPTSKAAYSAAVLSVTGLSYGRIEVKYADNSIYQYTIFTNVNKRVSVVTLTGTGYIKVKNPKNGRTVQVNVYTGAVTKTLLQAKTSRHTAK